MALAVEAPAATQTRPALMFLASNGTTTGPSTPVGALWMCMATPFFTELMTVTHTCPESGSTVTLAEPELPA